MYKTLKALDLPAIDKEILEFWKEHDVFVKSYEQRDPKDSFVFYEGPPSANGKPGIHHVMARTVKDLFCRFQSMKGKRVERKGGWDTHGLPIELGVEKELGITKVDIGTKISVEEYNEKCRETVLRYKDLWDDLTVKMGYWVDLDNPYITYDNEYIESVWTLLKKLYDQGLLYKGYTVQPFSPAAGTGLSTHELNMPGAYKTVRDTSIVAQFKAIQDEKSEFLFALAQETELFFLAWTTTPWTLPSNTALSMGPKINYALVKTFNPYTKLPVVLILASDLMTKWFKQDQFDIPLSDFDPESKLIPAEVLGMFAGSEFDSIRYEQLLPYEQPEDGRAFEVVLGTHVTTSDGTGIVHTAPSFGADDMMVAKKNGIGSLTMVDKEGKFIESAGEFAGRYVKDYTNDPDYVNVDIDISVKLKLENRAFNIQKYEHNYPHCWRTDKPVLYYPLDSWFVRTTAKKDRLVELNKTINWKPEHTGEKRFGNWLENLQDWNLSRSRFWGTPLPIWRTADGATELCIGSIEQLSGEIQKANIALGLSQDVPKDLHKPYIDRITLVSADGRPMERESDLIDVWFDSGAMPYAQWHYPFENQEKFKNNYPADFIAEGVDQTRGWFFTLHAIAGMVYDQVAYKTVVSNGLVQDKHGQKMSKSKGNAVEPFETLAKYGADAVRWYMMSNAAPWDNLKFDHEGIVESQRKFFGTLFHTYGFYALYANIDGFKMQYDDIALKDRPEIDRWILSSLNSLKEKVESCYGSYDVTPACRAIQEFANDQLSNWHVRLSRKRFWIGELNLDKISAYQTLYTCLMELSKLMAPVAPFFADWLFQNLNNVTGLESAESVHLADFPKADNNHKDADLEYRMDLAQQICSQVLSLRKKERIRVRQPLQKILIPVLDEKFKTQVELVEDLIKREVNIKEIEFLSDASGVIKKSVKPNFKTLGRRLGKDMKAAAAVISGFDDQKIQELETAGTVSIELDSGIHEITTEDVVIQTEDIPGWLVSSQNGLTVALDITLDEALEAEGMAKEVIKHLQTLRKESGFEVTERIAVEISSTHDLVGKAISLHGAFIAQEVLADKVDMVIGENGHEVTLVEGVDAVISVERV